MNNQTNKQYVDAQQMAKMRDYAAKLKRKKPSITFGKLARAVQRKFGVKITEEQ